MKVNENLDELMGRNPFKVPDGYFEDFTEKMMSLLPERPVERPSVISFYDRVKPWLYMAAAFVGIVVLFRFLDSPSDSATGKANPEKAAVIQPYIPSEDDENDAFREYIEEEYAEKFIAYYIFDMMD